MNQSTLQQFHPSPLHVAIIMDGSGRWATRRGLERRAGHRAGVRAVRRVAEAAPAAGIGTLTLDAFSADNWGRPEEEVRELLRIFQDYFEGEMDEWVARQVRVEVFGRRDRLPEGLRAAIGAAEAATRQGRAVNLRFAIDYSGREAILGAAGRLNSESAEQENFSRLLAEGEKARGKNGARSGYPSALPEPGPPLPDVDLLIRTGGELRLSDFMLWEIAYAELIFTQRLWPDFDAEDLRLAVGEFHSRERRFGRLPSAVAV